MGCVVVDGGSRRGPQAAPRGLQPRRVTRHAGTQSPTSGAAAVHHGVSAGEGGAFAADRLVVRLLRRSVNYGHFSLL